MRKMKKSMSIMPTKHVFTWNPFPIKHNWQIKPLFFSDTQQMQFIFGGFQMQKPNPNECWLWSRSKEVNLTERKPTNCSLPLFNKIFLDIFYSCGTLVLIEIYILYTRFDVKKSVWPLLHMTWCELFCSLSLSQHFMLPHQWVVLVFLYWLAL